MMHPDSTGYQPIHPMWHPDSSGYPPFNPMWHSDPSDYPPFHPMWHQDSRGNIPFHPMWHSDPSDYPPFHPMWHQDSSGNIPFHPIWHLDSGGYPPFHPMWHPDSNDFPPFYPMWQPNTSGYPPVFPDSSKNPPFRLIWDVGLNGRQPYNPDKYGYYNGPYPPLERNVFFDPAPNRARYYNGPYYPTVKYNNYDGRYPIYERFGLLNESTRYLPITYYSDDNDRQVQKTKKKKDHEKYRTTTVRDDPKQYRYKPDKSGYNNGPYPPLERFGYYNGFDPVHDRLRYYNGPYYSRVKYNNYDSKYPMYDRFGHFNESTRYLPITYYPDDDDRQLQKTKQKKDYDKYSTIGRRDDSIRYRYNPDKSGYDSGPYRPLERFGYYNGFYPVRDTFRYYNGPYYPTVKYNNYGGTYPMYERFGFYNGSTRYLPIAYYSDDDDREVQRTYDPIRYRSAPSRPWGVSPWYYDDPYDYPYTARDRYTRYTENSRSGRCY